MFFKRFWWHFPSEKSILGKINYEVLNRQISVKWIITDVMYPLNDVKGVNHYACRVKLHVYLKYLSLALIMTLYWLSYASELEKT